MKKNAGIFVRISYKLDDNSKTIIKDMTAKYREMNIPRYLLCGGTHNKNGGTFIFHANNLKEAEMIINNNPFVGTEFYSFEIFSKNYIAL
ncbi:hypothetical protein CPJCM30710_15570 [Clostridium polyendosporum]|uniref:YCII-related domain-containing protein n=1 Tax=Clostridium polyendosporum TaxID=69208 RepID=A0A919VGQ8_9CLOT|nr:hypothetical protein [Clostridium polyendosporum]GIM28891.1 hypothetical protein CPJCM30710_15570 [Clostridium polyendosporum]